MKKRKVLLLGGTGAMGVYLAPILARLGYIVYITSRNIHTSQNPNIIYIVGNAKEKEFRDELLKQKFDAIIDFMKYKVDHFSEIYEDLLNNTQHYLFLSSYRVYAENDGQPLTERSSRLLDTSTDEIYLSTMEYALTKAREENILYNASQKNWTILQPAITYSKERFQLGTMEAEEFLIRALSGKKIIFPKQMLDKITTMSWGNDVAQLISRLVLNKDALGQAYIISTSESHTWKEVISYYTFILGKFDIQYIDLPLYEELIGRPYQIHYDRMFNRRIDNSKILNATGMTQNDFMPLEQGLRQELLAFVKKPIFQNVNIDKQEKIDSFLENN